MAVIVRLQIFSGRPDPEWLLSKVQALELTRLISSLTRRTLLKPPAVAGGLGYRGLLITAPEMKSLAPESFVLVHSGVIERQRFGLCLVDEGNQVERWLLDSGKNEIDSDLRSYIDSKISFAEPLLPSFASVRPPMKVEANDFHLKSRHHVAVPKPVAAPPPPCRPQYDPTPWDSPDHVSANNCYNYATDLITDTNATPGLGSGHPCCETTASITCENVTKAVTRDGSMSVPNVGAAPANAHYVALAIWPLPGGKKGGTDFHFYRRDCNGYWSHKISHNPVQNTDANGQLIADPQNAARDPYTEFCGYFTCDPNVVTVE